MMRILAAFLITFILPLPVIADDPAPDNTPAMTTEIVKPEIKEYTACGCGCCSGVTAQAAPKCVADAKSLKEIIKQDKDFKTSANCAIMGCAAGTKYTVCK